MKTNFFNKSQECKSNDFIVLSQEELNKISGGIWMMIRHADGTISFEYFKD